MTYLPFGRADDALVEEDPECLEPENCTDAELGLDVPFTRELVEQWAREDRMVREAWRYLPNDPLPVVAAVAPATVGTVVRALRWRTRLSQRELAAAAGVPASTVMRAEQAGGADLRLSTFERMLDACGLRLVVVDDEGTQLAVPYRQHHGRDAADRRPAAHRQQETPRSRRGIGL